MATTKKYTQEEIDNINGGRSAVEGAVYEGFSGDKFIGLSGGFLRYMIKSSEVVANDSAKSQLSTVLAVTKQAEVDFGSVRTLSQKLFTVTDADAKEGKLVIPVIAYEAPTGKSLDEVEMDSFEVKGRAQNGLVDLLVTSLTGRVTGAFKINYTLTL